MPSRVRLVGVENGVLFSFRRTGYTVSPRVPVLPWCFQGTGTGVTLLGTDSRPYSWLMRVGYRRKFCSRVLVGTGESDLVCGWSHHRSHLDLRDLFQSSRSRGLFPKVPPLVLFLTLSHPVLKVNTGDFTERSTWSPRGRSRTSDNNPPFPLPPPPPRRQSL